MTYCPEDKVQTCGCAYTELNPMSGYHDIFTSCLLILWASHSWQTESWPFSKDGFFYVFEFLPILFSLPVTFFPSPVASSHLYCVTNHPTLCIRFFACLRVPRGREGKPQGVSTFQVSAVSHLLIPKNDQRMSWLSPDWKTRNVQTYIQSKLYFRGAVAKAQ